MLVDDRVRLDDGRTLAYAEWGQRTGAPVVHCHGSPGSRLECWGGEEAYASTDTRLITVDRPGIGRSDPKPDRTVSQWADDVRQLADALAIQQFAILGHSAGGAYALACAHGLADRVGRVAVVGSIPQVDRSGGLDELGPRRYWKLARARPALMRAAFTVSIAALRRAPRIAHQLFFWEASPIDRDVLRRNEVRERFRAAALEGARPGVRGFVDDMRVLLQPWGFDPEAIRSETQFWHGAQDRHVPPSVSERLAQALPHARTSVVPGEGHFSLLERRVPEILETLAHGGSVDSPFDTGR